MDVKTANFIKSYENGKFWSAMTAHIQKEHDIENLLNLSLRKLNPIFFYILKMCLFLKNFMTVMLFSLYVRPCIYIMQSSSK